jgi:hypothetical protein
VSDLIGLLEAFTVTEIEKASLRLPVTAQLMDVSAVPFFELVAVGKDDLGIYSFEKKPLPGTLWKQGPHTVRFASEGTPSFLRDFPWPVNDK